jgi:hypothetical protein
VYTRCIFCSATLGRNETLEEFPVGRMLAFDAAKGRLWAVCSRCGRWNLAPIEERWEAVESLEKRFRDTRLKVQSESIGLSKAPDGTRLVRVGQALPGELAAWRYGDRFGRRKRAYLAAAGAGVLVTAGYVSAFLGVSALAPVAIPGFVAWTVWANLLVPSRRVAALGAAESPTGGSLVLRGAHLRGARVEQPVSGDERFSLTLRVPRSLPLLVMGWDRSAREVRLPEAQAIRVLRRGMVHVNEQGASAEQVRSAVDVLGRQGVDEYLRRFPRLRRELLPRKPHGILNSWLDGAPAPEVTLALEMALHEEDERRALQGELAELDAAWRDAEEIAAIADALPDIPAPLPPGSGAP